MMPTTPQPGPSLAAVRPDPGAAPPPFRGDFRPPQQPRRNPDVPAPLHSERREPHPPLQDHLVAPLLPQELPLPLPRRQGAENPPKQGP